LRQQLRQLQTASGQRHGTPPAIDESNPISGRSTLFSNLSPQRQPATSKEGIQDSNEGATNARTFSSFPNKSIGSRSSSISSQKSERGRSRIKKAFNRRSSIQSDTGHGFKDIVFDSRSNHSVSSSAGSFQSFSSVRSGRSSDVARKMMRAVKEIGACWRCKILRKTVSIHYTISLRSRLAISTDLIQCCTETPCRSCPCWGHNSAWRTLGCKRGNLKDQMPEIRLCEGTDLQYPMFQRGTPNKPFRCEQVNNDPERHITTRNERRLKWLSEES
jgi:hypothetical protein